MRRYLVLALCAALPACYAYLPAPSTAAAPGRQIRFTLTDSGSVMLAPRIGPGVDAVEGRVISDGDGEYLMAVRSTHHRDGSENDWNGERVGIAHLLVASVEERRFSPSRTLVFSTLASAALVGITEAMRGSGGATVPGPTPGGPGTGK